MAATSLGFYRKAQTIENLHDERPKSLPSFRNSVSDAIHEICTE